MNQHLSSASLKTMAKGQLLGKYGTAIGALMLMALCILPFTMAISFLVGSLSVINVIISSAAQFLLTLFTGLFLAGEAYIYLKTACGQKPTINDLFHCFGNDASKVIHIQAIWGGLNILSLLPASIINVFLVRSLQTLSADEISAGAIPMNPALFLIYVIIYLAGTIFSIYVNLTLSQVFYLMLDFPEYSASQLLKMGIRLMKGNKGRLFYIQLSFVPLLLLSIFSCGIALLWIYPYLQATYANFYLDLVRKKESSLI